ncbi:addiction module antitoxin [Sphingobium sp. Ant17]|nr:addiction module antitoxin [Sphingobium sp. Ant17]
MATMNISLPDPMRDYVQNRIDSGQYASVSDYVRDLIRRDQKRDCGQGTLAERTGCLDRPKPSGNESRWRP